MSHPYVKYKLIGIMTNVKNDDRYYSKYILKHEVNLKPFAEIGSKGSTTDELISFTHSLKKIKKQIIKNIEDLREGHFRANSYYSIINIVKSTISHFEVIEKVHWHRQSAYYILKNIDDEMLLLSI